jgi:hypothetical protein
MGTGQKRGCAGTCAVAAPCRCPPFPTPCTHCPHSRRCCSRAAASAAAAVPSIAAPPCRRLRRRRLRRRPQFVAQSFEKHIWICAFMLVGVRHKCTVGEAESAHGAEVSAARQIAVTVGPQYTAVWVPVERARGVARRGSRAPEKCLAGLLKPTARG